MNRRQYLASAGGVGIVAVSAGCLGDSEDIPEATDRTGERALDRAVGALNRAAIAMDESDDPETGAFDADEPREYLAEARDYLATAESELDADHDADIETLRSYADVLDGLVDVTETVADDTIEDDADEITAVMEDGGDIDAARQTIEDRNATLADARETLDTATDELASLDEDRLAELSIVDTAEIEDALTMLDDVLSSMITLGDGYETMIDGYDALDQGETEFEDENFGAAADAFETAESRFETATETFDEDDDPPDELDTHVQTARCQSSGLATAAGHFKASATAADDNDPQTAQNEQSAAEDALDSVDTCSS